MVKLRSVEDARKGEVMYRIIFILVVAIFVLAYTASPAFAGKRPCPVSEH